MSCMLGSKEIRMLDCQVYEDEEIERKNFDTDANHFES